MHDIDSILSVLLDRLWARYCQRVEYARRYMELVEQAGGNVVNDHIAFRTLNARTGSQPAGIAAIERVITRLGYARRGDYEFVGKNLTAHHYEHADPARPKIFISQLEVDRLDDGAQALIAEAVCDATDRLAGETEALLKRASDLQAEKAERLVDGLFEFFTVPPWEPPPVEAVRAVDKASQYGAWTLLHGNNVNHFTAYINEQNVPDWPDIDATVRGLREAGVPMKPTVEGAPGSQLRQSATQAVEADCPVRDQAGNATTLRWPYAYYELAERGNVVAPSTGKPVRFQGFLGPQATHLFDMTKR